jgi:O-antigen ligase
MRGARVLRTIVSRAAAHDWLLVVILCAVATALAFRDGGYFPPDWGWSGLALFWVAATALLLRDRFAVGRAEVVVLASLASFIGWVGLSWTWSTSTEASILEVQRAVVYFAALLVIFLVARGASVREPVVAAYAAALIVSTIALTRFLLEHRPTLPGAPVARLSEPFGYPNAPALVAAMGALLSTALAAHARATWARALAAASLVVFSLTLFFTFSRGGWIALAIGLVAMLSVDPRRFVLLWTLAAVAPVAVVAVWLASRVHVVASVDGRATVADGQGRLLAVATLLLAATAGLGPRAATLAARRLALGRRALLVAVTTVLVVCLTGSAAAIAHFRSRPFDSSVPSRELIRTQADSQRALSLSGRVPVWREAWHDWEDHRVLGSGAGTFEEYWLQHRDTSANVRDAHSLYLETLAELGPVGLGLLVTALSVPLLLVARTRFHPFAPAAAAAYVTYLVHAAGDWDWEMPAVTLLGLFCGAGLGSTAPPESTVSADTSRAGRGNACAGRHCTGRAGRERCSRGERPRSSGRRLAEVSCGSWQGDPVDTVVVRRVAAPRRRQHRGGRPGRRALERSACNCRGTARLASVVAPDASQLLHRPGPGAEAGGRAEPPRSRGRAVSPRPRLVGRASELLRLVARLAGRAGAPAAPDPQPISRPTPRNARVGRGSCVPLRDRHRSPRRPS